MKCPKCGYLGFDSGDRCRNCGYDFSLTQSPAVPDLPIRRDAERDSPLPDELPLSTSQARAGNRADRIGAGAAYAEPELPLFGEPPVEDVPLITRISAPRTPLSVRRATPEVPRLKPDATRAALLDLDLAAAADPPRAAPDIWRPSPRAVRPTAAAAAAVSSEDAPIAARFVAVAVDLMILAAVDLVVIYFTMQICGLTLQDLGLLPKGPLLAFLLVQNGGYLVAFTAGGQTLGKMAAGVRVVANDAGTVLDLGHAVVRELAWLVLAAPAGLGFLTAVFSADHRGLHDRFAGTRVVRR